MPNQYINKVIYGGRTLIDLTSDTVEASKLLLGTKAHDKSGAQIEGTWYICGRFYGCNCCCR